MFMVWFAVRGAALLLAASFVFASSALADFEAGQRAWDTGDIVEALAQWSAAADEGDPSAMLALGRLYREGLGVVQDYAEAYKWLNLAASRDNAEAASERNELSTSMTPGQLTEGQSLARAWRSGAGQASGLAELASPPAETASPSPPPPEATREAQRLLSTLGYQPGPADGIWGRRSAEAYRAFLRDAGLLAADVLTPQALLAMRSIAQRGDPQAEPDAAAPPPEAIWEAQKLLAALGYEAGPVDGRWGALMAQAYVVFLADAGLPTTGILTPEGLRALRERAYWVAQVQEVLVALGYEAGPVDGRWGALTAQAYAAFLADAGLPTTSILTPEGLRALRERADVGIVPLRRPKRPWAEIPG